MRSSRTPRGARGFIKLKIQLLSVPYNVRTHRSGATRTISAFQQQMLVFSADDMARRRSLQFAMTRHSHTVIISTRRRAVKDRNESSDRKYHGRGQRGPSRWNRSRQSDERTPARSHRVGASTTDYTPLRLRRPNVYSERVCPQAGTGTSPAEEGEVPLPVSVCSQTLFHNRQNTIESRPSTPAHGE